MVLSWLRGKPVPAPTDLELKLVDALEAVTQCVEDHSICADAAHEGRETLEKAKEALGIVEVQNTASGASA